MRQGFASFVIMVLILVTILGGMVRPAPLAAANPPTTVSLSGAPIAQGGVAAADLDGDGDQELIVGGNDGRLYVLAYNGSSWSQVWSRQTADDLDPTGAYTPLCAYRTVSDIRSAPAIGDLNDDGRPEIVVTTGGDVANHRNGGVLVYTYDAGQAWSQAFSLAPGWPQPRLDIVGAGAGASNPDGCWDGIWGSPALGDLDGNGQLEIAVEGFDRRLHVFRYDGTYVSGWPIQPPTIWRGGWATPAIADMDNDGLPEVIFATDNPTDNHAPFFLYVYNWDATLLPGFPVEADQNMASSPAIGDVDGDGWLDIVVGTGSYVAGSGKKVYAWDHLGNLLPGWPQATGGYMPASPALGDLDDDGDLEVVIGCGHEGDAYNPAPCSSMYAWHGNGAAVSGFPRVVSANDWSGTANGLPYAPILADYDGDGSTEILAVVRWSWGISTIEANGTLNNDSDLRANYSLYGSPIVSDVDGDGNLEIVIGGANSSGSNGMVYIWNYGGTTDDAQPWPMFHHDVARTGRYPWPPSLDFPTEIHVLHQDGSGNSATRSVAIQNGGDGGFDWSISHSIGNLEVIPASGTVEAITVTQFVVDTTGLSLGWHELGPVTVTGTLNGSPVTGSPTVATLWVYVGDVSRVYLPLTLRNQ